MKLFLSVLFVFSSLLLQADIPLAKDGKPVAEIVLVAKTDKVLSYAASELQHWVKEISGAELPIVNEAGKMDYKIILQAQPVAFAADLKRMQNNDGYAVRTKGKEVYVFASQSKGVLNGIFKLLFKNTDIIWARPNVDFGTIYSKNPNLTLTETDYIDIPAYVLRGWQMIGPWHHIPSEVWQVRNGNNWSAATNTYVPEFEKFGNILEYGGGHNLVGCYITLKKYAKTHPEFYSMRHGKRLLERNTQLCFTNPEMTKAFITELDAKIKESPNYDTYRIMIEDNYNVCDCPECSKPIQLEDGRIIDKKDKAFRSTQFFLWLNQIARHMQKNYPGKKILTFGYFFTEPPPYCKVEPNISISFCPITKNSKATMESPVNSITRNKLTGWLQNTKNITLREYYGLTPPFPRPIDAIAIADWNYANKLGMNKTYSEMYADADGRRMDGIKTWNVNSPYFWVMTNGAWNPLVSDKILRDEFFTRVYGAAADDVKKFYSLTENAWLKAGGSSSWRDTALQGWKNCTADEKQCRDLLTHAAQKVSNPNGIKMLAALRETFEEEIKNIRDAEVRAVNVSQPPVFDPDFNSEEWQKAALVDQFYVHQKKHKDRTVLRILYDNKNIYIGIKCFYKDVKKMRYHAPVPNKRTFPDGEGFEVFLSKNNKTSRDYTQVVVDPVNNRYWGGKSAGAWKSQSKITTDGWSAMITISWQALKLDPQQTTKIYGAFFRQYMPQPSPGCAPSQCASLFGSSRHNATTFVEILLK